MQVFVKTQDGTTITMNVSTAGSVTDFKVAVEGRTGVPPEQQVLSFAGKPLDGEASLRDYGIVAVAPQTHFHTIFNGGYVGVDRLPHSAPAWWDSGSWCRRCH